MTRFIALLVFLTIPSLALAQSCPYQYKYKDRDYVNQQIDLVANVLKRMHFLAVQCNKYDLNSRTQRAAMNAEYQALRTEITRIGNGPHPPILYRKTTLFLDSVIDSSFLNLDNTRLDADTREEAIGLTYEAIEANMNALVSLEQCF
jgi:hypothetical protein